MLRKILYDIKRGQEDGFPTCCITFYSLLWGRMSDISQISPRLLNTWSTLIGKPYQRLARLDEINWQRMPCPRCIIHDRLGLFI